jgi:oxalate---CoA ligase
LSENKIDFQVGTIAQLLNESARRQPSAAVLLAPAREALTYEGLTAQVAAVRHFVRQRGIQATDRVAICLPDGPEAAAAFLALACCCATAPLNSTYQHQELEFALNDLNVRAVVVPPGGNSRAAAVAGALGMDVLELIADTEREAGRFTLRAVDATICRPPADDGRDVRPDQLALLLHTSGTTSRPKLVPLSQRNLCVSATNIRSTLLLTEEDRCLSVMPMFHIHGLVGALLSTIAAGGSIVVLPGFNAETFLGAFDAFRPTWYTAVPTIHQNILDEAGRSRDVIDRTRLRFIRSSSAALPPSVMARLEKTFRAPVIESYGMTEASHQMASNALPPGRRVPGSVGRPAGPEIAVFDDAWNAVAPGEVGEVAIRGSNVTTGYVGNEEANGSAFRDGWFRTGDQGRFDEQGYLFLTGRLKELINRGGEKISPREIDEALLEHPDVTQAVAFGIPHKTLGEDLAAAVVLRGGSTVTDQLLRRFLAERLAGHKVPGQIVIVPEIPKGPTGKLRRIGLHQQLEHLLKPPFVPVETTGEKTLAQIWCKLFEVKDVGALDDFFARGGDSLAAARLANEIADLFDISFTVAEVFRHPVLRDQSRLIEASIIADIERGAD